MRASSAERGSMSFEVRLFQEIPIDPLAGAAPFLLGTPIVNLDYQVESFGDSI